MYYEMSKEYKKNVTDGSDSLHISGSKTGGTITGVLVALYDDDIFSLPSKTSQYIFFG